MDQRVRPFRHTSSGRVVPPSRSWQTWMGLVVVLGLPVVCPRVSAGEGTERVPLETSLPKPVFSGTPRFIVSPNLEKVSGKVREPFLVPRGSINLAKGCPVTASDASPFVGQASKVTDGDKEAAGNSFVELGEGVQWVEIDLGVVAAIDAVIVWHYHGEARVFHDVIVRLGTEAGCDEDAVTLFNNDHDNSSGLGAGVDKEYVETFEGRLIPAAGQAARFVRLYSNGNTTDDMNDYVEVEVWGTPRPAL